MLTSDEPDLAEVLRQQESLRKVIELISSELELRPLLSRIIFYACELLGAEKGAIGLIDEERQVMRTEAIYNMPEEELGAEIVPGIGLAGHVWQTQQPILLNRYGDLELPMYQTMLEDAVIGLPIFWRDQMIGYFGIGANPPHRFKPSHVETLALFARHAAVTIVNAKLFTELQRNLEETRLLYETTRHIGAAMNVDEVIFAYLKQVAARGRYTCNVALYEFNEKGERVAVRVQGCWSMERGFERPDLSYSYSRDALDDLLDAGQTVLIEDVNADPRVPVGLRDIQQQSGRPALAMIPLMADKLRVGLVILSYPIVHHWNPHDLRPYQVTASQLEMAIVSRQQHQLLLNRDRQVVVLEERRRLACELHDSVTHLMFSVTLIAQSIAPAWRRSPTEGEERINRLLELSQMAMAEMRALLTELRPTELMPAFETEIYRPTLERLKQYGLPGALQKHITDIGRDDLQIAISAEGYRRQQLEIEETLYRITQEALNNVIKHAQATSVQIKLYADDGIIYLTVLDNGIGFRPVLATVRQQHSHLGLKTMRERAEALGGSLQLTTTPGYGTKLEVVVPGS
jgi:signal transduction histidine kinase